MADIWDVRLHNESCPGLDDLLGKLRHTQAPAGVWRRALVITLRRMGLRQNAFARVTAATILNLMSTRAGSTRYPRSITARAMLERLRAMDRQRLSASDLKPRSGLHPEVLALRYAQTVRLFVKGRGTRPEADALLESWGRRPLTDAGWLALVEARTDLQRARLFMARVARVTPASLKTMLISRKGSRAREWTMLISQKGNRARE